MWGSSFKRLYVLVMHESTCNLQGPGNTPMGEAGLGQLYQKIKKGAGRRVNDKSSVQGWPKRLIIYSKNIKRHHVSNSSLSFLS